MTSTRNTMTDAEFIAMVRQDAGLGVSTAPEDCLTAFDRRRDRGNGREAVPARKAAFVYTARKWNPIPLPFKAKKPTGNEWQKRVIGEADLPQCFNGKQQNVGVVLGPTSNGLTDIDLDCREAVELASHTLPKTDAIFGRASAPASHRLYRTTLASKSEDENATFQLRDPTNKATAARSARWWVQGRTDRLPRFGSRER